MNKLSLEKNDYLFVARKQTYSDGKDEKRLQTGKKIFGMARAFLLTALIALFVLTPYTFVVSLSNRNSQMNNFMLTMMAYLYGLLVFFIVGCVIIAKSSRGKYNDMNFFRVGNICTTRFITMNAIGLFLTIWRIVSFSSDDSVASMFSVLFTIVLVIVTLFYAASLLLCVWNKYLLYKLTPEDYIEYEKCKI